MVHVKYDQLLMIINYYLVVLGALAIAVANPTDLVKVRLQAEGKLAPGVPRRYSGALNAYSTIVRQVMSSVTFFVHLLIAFIYVFYM